MGSVDLTAIDVLAILAGLLVVFGGSWLVYLIGASRGGPVGERFDSYVKDFAGRVRFATDRDDGEQLAKLHVVACIVMVGLCLALGDARLIVIAIIVVFGPKMWLESKREKRVEEIEAQTDGWLLMLSNALRASPAIGEALASTVQLVEPPIRDELEIAVKESQLGVPVDELVHNMGTRVGSPIVSGALATIIIARQTGGDLPTVLDTTAEAMREAQRLEGVLKTKTSEGRAQLKVLALMPFCLCAMIAFVDPTYFIPIQEHRLGNLIVGVSLIIWMASLFWARKILSVQV